MTSVVSREDVLDALYGLAPRKPAEIRRVMQIIDRYTASVLHRNEPELEATSQ